MTFSRKFLRYFVSTDLRDIHVEIQRCYNDSTTWRSRGDQVDVFAVYVFAVNKKTTLEIGATVGTK